MNQLCFVFGSNLAGRHGKGAALAAKQRYGAVYGQGVGRQGNSYAIPTKDFNLKTMALQSIRHYVLEFEEYARENPDLDFMVTKVGCGLAGYDPYEIGPMFAHCPENVILPPEFDVYRRMKQDYDGAPK